MGIKNSSYRGRRTPEEIAAEAIRKKDARAQVSSELQRERNDLAMTLISVIEQLRNTEHLDVRRPSKVEIDLDAGDNIGVVVHTKVHPTQKFLVLRKQVEETKKELEEMDDEWEESSHLEQVDAAQRKETNGG